MRSTDSARRTVRDFDETPPAKFSLRSCDRGPQTPVADHPVVPVTVIDQLPDTIAAAPPLGRSPSWPNAAATSTRYSLSLRPINDTSSKALSSAHLTLGGTTEILRYALAR